jgi:hypothetical protein
MKVQPQPQQVVVNRAGKPMAVILSILDYRKLLRLADDHADASTLQRAIRTSRGTISHGELMRRLKRQGLV